MRPLGPGGPLHDDDLISRSGGAYAVVLRWRMTSTPPAQRLAIILDAQAAKVRSTAAAEALRAAATHVSQSLDDDQASYVLAALDDDNMVLHREYNLEGKTGREVIEMILQTG